MKKMLLMAVCAVFVLSASCAFAGGAPAYKTAPKGKPFSKSINVSVGQAAADNIKKFGAGTAAAKEMSLRDNKAELARRRGCPK